MGRIFEGVVVSGRQLGRQLGFPTANISIAPDEEVEDGVYFSLVRHNQEEWCALSNVGSNPTVGGQTRLLESHLIDFGGATLYGERVEVELLCFHREEIRFASLEGLKEQISKDLRAAYGYFGLNKI